MDDDEDAPGPSTTEGAVGEGGGGGELDPHTDLFLPSAVQLSSLRLDLEQFAASAPTGQREAALELLARHTGGHQWIEAKFARPTFCSACNEKLAGMPWHGFACDLCKTKAHRKCRDRITSACKWTDAESVPAELISYDASYYPHQWIRGGGGSHHHRSSAKCVHCEKPVGSVLKLQYLEEWRCAWCSLAVHSACKTQLKDAQNHCRLGSSPLSVLPPLAVRGLDSQGGLVLDAAWLGVEGVGGSPLVVLVNSKSGENQGARLMRKLRRLLNPLQVFDVIAGGPEFALNLMRSVDGSFRVLVCGGDGTIGWVLSACDRLGVLGKVQLGVVPLGTGNDLARVLGWGRAWTGAADDALPLLLKRFERAHVRMLDRWSVAVNSTSPQLLAAHHARGPPIDAEAAELQRRLAQLVDTIVRSQRLERVLHAAVELCRLSKRLLLRVGQTYRRVEEWEEEEVVVVNGDQSAEQHHERLSTKCETLLVKLEHFVATLEQEEAAARWPEVEQNDEDDHENSHATATAAESGVEEGAEDENETAEHPHHHQQQLHRHQVEMLSDRVEPEQEKRTSERAAVARAALVGRANSLKKALVDILAVAERRIDEQNGVPPASMGARAATELFLSAKPEPSAARRQSSLREAHSHSGDHAGPSHARQARKMSEHSCAVEGIVGQLTRKPHSETHLQVADDEEERKRKVLLSYSETSLSERQPYRRRSKKKWMARVLRRRSKKDDGEADAESDDEERGDEDGRLKAGRLVAELLLLNRHVLLHANQEESKKRHLANGSSEEDKDDELDDGNVEIKEVKVMNNYCGIGLDAKIALDFHVKREDQGAREHSRSQLFLWYGMLGGKQLLQRTYKGLEQRIELECDGVPVALPALEGIVILNIPSYSGGANLWGTAKEDAFTAQSFDDKLLEVVALFSVMHVARSRLSPSGIVRLHNHRLAQCRRVRIRLLGDQNIPIQVDGEPWLQSAPVEIVLEHKNRAQLLVRDRDFEAQLDAWQRVKEAGDSTIFEQRPTPSATSVGSSTSKTLASSMALPTSTISAPPSTSAVEPSEALSTAAAELVSAVQAELGRLELSQPLLDALEAAGAAAATGNGDGQRVVDATQRLVDFVDVDGDGPAHDRIRAAIEDWREEMVAWQRARLTRRLSLAASSTPSPSAHKPSTSTVNVATSPHGLTGGGGGSSSGAGTAFPATTGPIMSSSSSAAIGSTGRLHTLVSGPQHGSSASGGGGPTQRLTRWLRAHLAKKAPGQAQEIPKDVSSAWAVEDVCTWLMRKGLGAYVPTFRANDIAGAELLLLRPIDYAHLGITKRSHVQRLQEGIADLTRRAAAAHQHHHHGTTLSSVTAASVQGILSGSASCRDLSVTREMDSGGTVVPRFEHEPPSQDEPSVTSL